MSELNTPEFALAVTIEDAINNYSFDPKTFAKCIKHMHPTTQQSFFRLIKESIITMADPDRKVDPRNKMSKDICQEIVQVVKDRHIPFV